jgi:hypothetical protein
MDFVNQFKKLLKDAIIEQSKKDIIIKSKDRDATKLIVGKWFKANKVAHKDVFKASKSSSINVFEITGIGDVIFKPIIQKGAGGVAFEHELETDLTNYWNGVPKDKLKHHDVLTQMEAVMKINQKDKHVVVPMGSKNQKRALVFDGKSLSVSNSTGKTLTDLTLKNSKGKEIYCSLKMSKSFYILSAAIEQYFANKNTQVALCTYLGMDGYKMGGFGLKYRCKTPSKVNYSAVRSNLESFLTELYGTDVIVIHKKTAGDVKVSKIPKGSFAKISLSPINEDSYVYPEEGVRKYAVIKFTGTINNSKYKIDFQFRGTTASDTGPKYLRILLERL